MPVHVSSTMRSSSGCQNCIIQHLVSSHSASGRPVHRMATYRYDDTRCCIIQFWHPDDEHIVLETCTGIQLTYYKTRFCALSWLITKIILRCAVRKTSKFPWMLRGKHSISTLDWSVCICLTQLYVGRDMYRIYYIKNYMFRHFTLVIFRLRN